MSVLNNNELFLIIVILWPLIDIRSYVWSVSKNVFTNSYVSWIKKGDLRTLHNIQNNIQIGEDEKWLCSDNWSLQNWIVPPTGMYHYTWIKGKCLKTLVSIYINSSTSDKYSICKCLQTFINILLVRWVRGLTKLNYENLIMVKKI